MLKNSLLGLVLDANEMLSLKMFVSVSVLHY